MAPFKLKFRMGSSRSTSQEHDPDPQVNEALLGAQQQQEQQQQHQHQHQHQEQQQQQQQQQQQHHQAAASSSSTLDSADCSSLGSMSSERKLLLPPNKTSSSSVLNSNSLRLGYINQSRTPCINESPTDTDTANLPTTPPPSYEHVLEENTRLSQHQRQLSTDSAATPNQNSRRSSANSSRHSAAQLSAALEQHLGSVGGGSSGGSSICNDPDCHQNINQNYGNCGSGHLIASNNNSLHNNNNNEGEHQQIIEGVTELELHSDNGDYDCQEVDNTLSVSEFLLETEMATATSGSDDKGFGETGDGQCTDAQCTQCGGEDGCNRNDNGENESVVDGEEGGGASTSSHAARQSFYDPLLNRGNYGNYSETASTKGASSSGQACQEACCAQGSASGLGRRQQQHQQQQQQATCHSNLLQSPEMMSNKTSKEIYKDLAKQWGITCKMSESCRCMECQSHYFDCDYDDNEHQKTDGGLGAGTPMFISEVMHGSGCNIL